MYTYQGLAPALVATVSDHFHFTIAVALPAMTLRGVGPCKEVGRRLERAGTGPGLVSIGTCLLASGNQQDSSQSHLF